MSGLNPNTGNEKMDEAYNRLSLYVESFEGFTQFYDYFFKIVRTDDKEVLNKWLLKVLYVNLKQTPQPKKHKFDVLLERVSVENKAMLESWLENKLKEVGGEL